MGQSHAKIAEDPMRSTHPRWIARHRAGRVRVVWILLLLILLLLSVPVSVLLFTGNLRYVCWNYALTGNDDRITLTFEEPRMEIVLLGVSERKYDQYFPGGGGGTCIVSGLAGSHGREKHDDETVVERQYDILHGAKWTLFGREIHITQGGTKLTTGGRTFDVDPDRPLKITLDPAGEVVSVTRGEGGKAKGG